MRFGWELLTVSNDEIRAIFHLNTTPSGALEKVKVKHDEGYSILLAHALMRGGVERKARQLGISKIAYGLMREDLAASILKGLFIGFHFDGAYRKAQGAFDLIYPLWPVGKKELTLYLEAVSPQHNRQGSPPQFVRGSLVRDAYYMLVDTIETVLPGATDQLLAAHARTNSGGRSHCYELCSNCGSTYCVLSDVAAVNSESRCDVCVLLGRLDLLT